MDDTTWTKRRKMTCPTGSEVIFPFVFKSLHGFCSQKTISSIFVVSQPVQFGSVAQSCLTLCDPMNRSMPGLPVRHQLPESTQTHVH